ncbi:MAG: glycosyltransferase family 39 protein, partial [Microcystaceae cyanobacterium]
MIKIEGLLDIMNLKSPKKFLQYYHYLQPYQSGILLLIWTAIAALLRLNNLTAKPIWTDEFATLVFSLGNNFDKVPLGQIISAQTLLEPLRINPNQNINNVIELLLDKDNHPPFYFAIAHLWQTFLPHGDYINLWVSRALPAFFGILAIPIAYFISYHIFKSKLLAHLTALLMAVSPYGVFLSQEARHYTFAML